MSCALRTLGKFGEKEPRHKVPGYKPALCGPEEETVSVDLAEHENGEADTPGRCQVAVAQATLKLLAVQRKTNMAHLTSPKRGEERQQILNIG